MQQMLSTDEVAPGQRLAYWTDLVCGTYVQLECDAPVGVRQIDGRISASSLAGLQLSQVTASAQLVRRTPAKIAGDAEDYFLVSIQTAGQGVVSQDGRDARLGPGDFALYDSTRPYTLRFDGAFQQFVLKLPGRTLRTRVRETQHLTATAVSGACGAGHLMISMIQTLATDIDTLAPECAAAVADSVTHILSAGLSTLPAARRAPVSSRHVYQREQIKACVQARLRDPALSVAAVATALRTSPSTLHRVWAGEPCSLADWIWAQRLDTARRELCDPAQAARSVSTIAYALGFNDAAHFSRAFRARFGCTPRDLRASG